MTGFQIMGIENLRSPVAAIITAANEITDAMQLVDRQARALNLVREQARVGSEKLASITALHVRGPIYGDWMTTCKRSGHDYLEPDAGPFQCVDCPAVGHCCEHCTGQQAEPVAWPCDTMRIVERVPL